MKHSTNQPSQRQLRVGEQLRHILAEILQRGHFKNELLINHGSDITVTEVRPTPDLKSATVFVISLGGHEMDKILPALNDAAYYFQKEINRSSNLKFTPRLKFKQDGSFDTAQKLDSILHNIHYSDQE